MKNILFLFLMALMTGCNSGCSTPKQQFLETQCCRELPYGNIVKSLKHSVDWGYSATTYIEGPQFLMPLMESVDSVTSVGNHWYYWYHGELIIVYNLHQ